MSQLRLITENAADLATLVVAGAAAGMGAENLLTDIKGQVCRILAGSGQITATWAAPQTVGAVVIPASNLGSSSLIRVKVYSDAAGTALLHDTGDRYAAPGGILAHWDFSQPLNVNQFAFGFAPETAVYLPEHFAARRVEILLSDPSATFIDLSRLVIGRVLTTTYNANYGQADGLIDLSVNSRAASGDLKTERGPKAKRLSFSLDSIPLNERSKLRRVLDIGVGRFIWAALAAEDADPEMERDKSIYGKLAQAQTMQWNTYNQHAAAFDIEGF